MEKLPNPFASLGCDCAECNPALPQPEPDPFVLDIEQFLDDVMAGD